MKLFFTILGGLVLSVCLLLYFRVSSDSQRQYLPLRLQIPRIAVDASIEQVGLTPTGAMGIPQIPTDVAWYNLGPRPGEIGSAVIDGHLDDQAGKPAVFAHLDKLQKGDLLSVLDEKGKTLTFVVRETRLYDFDAPAPEVFTSPTGAHLNLITCQGSWNKLKQVYSKRLVVFADLQK